MSPISSARTSAFLLAFSVLLAACSRPTLSSMQTPTDPSTRELVGDDQRAARDELARASLHRLGSGWTIEGSRFFLTHPDTAWVAVQKLVGNDLVQRGAAGVPLEDPDPGHDAIAVWKLGWLRPDYLAVAITPGKTDGQLLVGYFALDRD